MTFLFPPRVLRSFEITNRVSIKLRKKIPAPVIINTLNWIFKSHLLSWFPAGALSRQEAGGGGLLFNQPGSIRRLKPYQREVNIMNWLLGTKLCKYN